MGIKNKQSGFTIVELLIVIVVIGILAAIVIVAFNGVQNRANNTSVQSDLKNIAKLIEQHKALNGDTVPAYIDNLPGVKVSRSAYGNHYNNGSGLFNLLYCYNANNDYAIVAISKSGDDFQYSSVQGGLGPHGYDLIGSGTSCPRTGVTGHIARWGYSGGNWMGDL